MAKAKPTPFMPAGYSDWPIRRCIAEAVNVCRYSPWKAHEWMEEARNLISMQYPFYDDYDNAVDTINRTWRSFEKYQWYDAREFWKRGNVSCPAQYLKRIDEDFS